MVYLEYIQVIKNQLPYRNVVEDREEGIRLLLDAFTYLAMMLWDSQNNRMVYLDYIQVIKNQLPYRNVVEDREEGIRLLLDAFIYLAMMLWDSQNNRIEFISFLNYKLNLFSIVS